MTTILLLHGALGSTRQVNPLHPHLEKTVRPVAMNFAGHGGWDPAAVDFSIAGFTAQLHKFMDEQALPELYIFGYSMGGYVALNAAAQSDRIRGVVTLGTKFDWTPETAAREVRMLNPDKIEAKVPAFAALLADRHGKENWKTVVRRTADMLTSLGENPPLTPDLLREIDIPVTIGWGERDEMVSRDESEQTAQALPNGTFTLLPDTPHPFEKADPQRIASFILDQVKY